METPARQPMSERLREQGGAVRLRKGGAQNEGSASGAGRAEQDAVWEFSPNTALRTPPAHLYKPPDIAARREFVQLLHAVLCIRSGDYQSEP
ncbi:hypothetical protein AOLI_G00220710 [Acnodon oligacanthus]